MASQLISDLKSRIDSQIAAGSTLTLNADVIGVADMGEVFDALLERAELEISNTVATLTGDVLTVAGQADWLSATLISLTIEFRDVASNLEITIIPQEGLTLADVSDVLFAGAVSVPQPLADLELSDLKIPTATDTAAVTAELAGSQSLAGGQIVLRSPTLLSIEASDITQPTSTILVKLAAKVTLAGQTFTLSGEYAPGNEADAVFQVEPGLDSVNVLLEEWLGLSVSYLEDLELSDIQIGKLLVDDSFQFSGRVGDEWLIPLGPTGLEVKDTRVSIVRASGEMSGTISGTVSVAGASVDIISDLDGQLTLSGQLPETDPLSLMGQLTGASLSLPPGLPDLTLPSSDFYIQPIDGSVRFLLNAPVGGWGTAYILVAEINGEWEAALLLQLPADWRFSDLSNLLQPLDALKIRTPKLLFASFDMPELTLPLIDGEAIVLVVQQGLSLSADLILEGLGLDLIGNIIGKEELPLALTVGDDFANTNVCASYDKEIPIIPNTFVLDDMGINVVPSPFAVDFSSRALITIVSDQLPEFVVGGGITDGGFILKGMTAEIWNEPFGISNLTINKLVFQMETGPPLRYAILGEIAVADDKIIKAAVELVGGYSPSMISGKLDGRISLAEIVKELVNLTLPDILDMYIEDVEVRAVGDPAGVTIGDEFFEPGLALQGTMGFLGLEMYSKVVVEPDQGIYAHASLTDIVSLGNVLTISNAVGDGPAAATLDTRQSPFLVISGRYSILGLGETIDAVVDDSGIAVAVSGDFGLAHYQWSCRVKSLDDFSAEGSFDFGIEGAIGPIRLAPGTPSLGTIKIDTGFEGRASIVVLNDQFSGSIEGGFHFQGLDLKIPELTLTVSPESLEAFPGLVWQQITANAEDIFSDFLQDADKWLLALRDGIVDGVEDVALVLRDQFGRTVEQIGNDIRNTLERGSEAAAQGLKDIGEGAEHIANVLKGLGDSQSAVKSALQGAGFPADEVSRALQVSFGIPHADFPAQGHFDTPLTPHGDTPLTPHGDTPLTPHGDTPIIPHGDRSKQGHIDIQKTLHLDIPSIGHADFREGHIDSGGFIHGDFAGIHGDTVATPHGDTPLTPHGDTPFIPHIDTPKVGHVDIPTVAHADFPPVAHADFPPVAHADTLAIPHGDGP